MTQPTKAGNAAPRRRSNWARDALVLLCTSLGAVAFGAGLRIQFGVTLILSIVGALAIHFALLTTHLIMRRSRAISALEEQVNVLREEFLRLKDPPPPAMARSRALFGRRDTGQQRAASSPPFDSMAATNLGPAAPATMATAAPSGGDTRPAGPVVERSKLVVDPSVQPAVAYVQPNHQFEPRKEASVTEVDAPRTPFIPALAKPVLAPSTELGPGVPTNTVDPFAFRPSPTEALMQPQNEAAKSAHQLSKDKGSYASSVMRSEFVTSSTSPAADVNLKRVQGMIKKLADEYGGPSSTQSFPTQPWPSGPGDAESPINGSLGALGSISETTQSNSKGLKRLLRADTAAAESVANPPPLADSADGSAEGFSMVTNSAIQAQIVEAIEAERIDVYLHPIHALPDRKPRHFQIGVWLRGTDGRVFDDGEVQVCARESGLLPRIDATKLLGAARVAQRLRARGRPGEVFSALAGESLADAEFRNACATEFGNGRNADLILGFAQSDVRTFATRHLETLASMAQIGFRFALEEVTDLDMDFEGLTRQGFAFVKLDARTFLEGMPMGEQVIPPADLCRHLANLGLTLIVGRIDDEWALARILGFGVLFGQGALFGAPKLVRADVLDQARTAA
jgi:EAL domain-containing protein (putative c-di-GMP-specific phosphodiesterase class I)